MTTKFLLVTAVALLTTGAAHAITVDGSYDAAYGAAKTVVPYAPGPNGDFNTFGAAASPGYSIYLATDNAKLYGYLRANTAAGGTIVPPTFANVYFDIDPATGNGADIGFELSAGHQNVFTVFVAPMPVAATGIAVAVSADQAGIEFSIPNSYFMSAYPGLVYDPAQVFAVNGGRVTLRISQSFGYDVVGGPSFGPERLGGVNLAPAAAVPEPATWALLLTGFGAVGSALRRRRPLAVPA